MYVDHYHHHSLNYYLNRVWARQSFSQICLSTCFRRIHNVAAASSFWCTGMSWCGRRRRRWSGGTPACGWGWRKASRGSRTSMKWMRSWLRCRAWAAAPPPAPAAAACRSMPGLRRGAPLWSSWMRRTMSPGGRRMTWSCSIWDWGPPLLLTLLEGRPSCWASLPLLSERTGLVWRTFLTSACNFLLACHPPRRIKAKERGHRKKKGNCST